MELGKYKKAIRASTRPTHLRRVVYDPSIDDLSIDFPSIEQPFTRPGFKDGKRAMTVTEKFIEANRAKQAAASEAAKKKFMEAEVTKPTPTSYGGKLDVKYADEAQQEIVEDLIKQKFSYPKNSVEGRNIDKYLMNELDLNSASLERITRVIKNKYQLKNPKASEFYIGEKKRQRKIDEIRRRRVKELQGARINMPKSTGKEFHHVMPLAGKELITDKGVAAIDRKMNAELSKYNVQLNKNADRIKELSTMPDSPARRAEIEKINFSNKNIISKAGKELPSQYRGLLGYYEYDTVDLNQPRKKKALNPKKTIGGLEGEELVFKTAKPEQIQNFKNKLATIDTQDATNAVSSLACPAQYADGGRVKFSKGSRCYAQGLKILEDAKAGDAKAKAKVAKGMKGLKILGGVATEILFETAFLLPSIAEGKPLDVLIGESTLGYLGLGTSEDEKTIEMSGYDPRVIRYITAKRAYEDNKQIPLQQEQMVPGLDEEGDLYQNLEERKKANRAVYEKFVRSNDRDIAAAAHKLAQKKKQESYDENKKGLPARTAQAILDALQKTFIGQTEPGEVFDLSEFQDGGRVGFKQGGITRRGFIKGLAALAAVIAGLRTGKGTKVVPKTTTATQVVENEGKGTPEWFAPLVDKIKTEGIDVPAENVARTSGRESVTKLEVKNPESNTTDSYYLFENPDTGEVRIDVDALGVGANDGEFSLYMRPRKVEGLTDEGIQQIDEGEFFVTEDRAVGRMDGPDDYDIDLEALDTDLSGSASNWHQLEEFATGKTDKAAQTEQLKKKDYIERNPADDIENRYGPFDDTPPDDY
jgi:hypothetical protein